MFRNSKKHFVRCCQESPIFWNLLLLFWFQRYLVNLLSIYLELIKNLEVTQHEEINKDTKKNRKSENEDHVDSII